jgi:DNA-binding NarL/FixJ family response regulator
MRVHASSADGSFAERVEPLSRDGIPDIPILDALIHLDLAQRSTGAAKNAARTRTERTLTTSGGERLLATLFEPDTRSVEENAAQTSVLATLSDREREIATLLLEGLSYAQIGKELFIIRSTVGEFRRSKHSL